MFFIFPVLEIFISIFRRKLVKIDLKNVFIHITVPRDNHNLLTLFETTS